MPLARAISRGAFLKARLGVNGIQNDSRSLGTAVATASVRACGMRNLPDGFWARASARNLGPGIAAAARGRNLRAGCGTRPIAAPTQRIGFRSERAAVDSPSPLAGRGVGRGVFV